jgi:glycosyltransferase 2 family protein
MTTSSPPAAPPASWLRRHGIKLAASLVIAAGFAWLLERGALPLLPPRDALENVRWWTVAGATLGWCAVHLVRAARWGFLLRPLHPVPMRRILAVSFVGFAAIVLLPLRTGEAVRPVLIHKKGQLSGWAATGTIGAERIIDGLFLSVMLLAAMQLTTPLSPLPDRIGNLPVSASVVPSAAYVALGLFAGAFTTMGIFYWHRHFARRVTHRVVGLFSARGAEWLAERVERLADGLRFLTDARHSVPFILATAVYWGLNAAATWLLCWGCGLEGFTFLHACVTTGVLALGILVPNAPGFFGAYQISLYAAFAMYYPAEAVTGAGAAYVFLAYLIQLAITVLAGVWGMLQEHTGLGEALAPE